MITSLTDGLNDADKKEMKGLFTAALRLRKRYVEILERKVRTTSTERLKKTYDEPSWAFHQADLNGYERALNELITLLNDKMKEE